MQRIVLAASILFSISGNAMAEDIVPVTVDNFIRAESDMYLSAVARKEDGFGKFEHHRELSPIDAQTVIRMNRDMLYSAAVFDLDAGPVTVTLPDAGERFMSLQLISQDEFTPPAEYGAGPHTITKEKIGTRYGGCDGKVPNCLPIMAGWSYTLRLYRPRAEILNGTWKAPEPEPAG